MNWAREQGVVQFGVRPYVGNTSSHSALRNPPTPTPPVPTENFRWILTEFLFTIRVEAGSIDPSPVHPRRSHPLPAPRSPAIHKAGTGYGRGIGGAECLRKIGHFHQIGL